MLVAWVGLLYVYAPIKMRIAARYEREPELVFFPDDTESLPPDVAAFFDRTGAELVALGFTAQDRALLAPTFAPNVRIVIKVFVNRADLVMAVIRVVYARIVHRLRPYASELQFGSRFRDGPVTQMLTTNSREPNSLGDTPHWNVLQLPQVTDARALYEIHKQRIDGVGSVRNRLFRLDTEFGGDIIATLKATTSDQLTEQINTGYLELSADGRYFRPTWKGAILVTWRNLWPMKQFRRVKLRRRAQRILDDWK